MGTIKFTDKFLKGAKPAAGEGTTRFWDSETMGLCVAVGKRARTFYVKAGGKMYKIGGWPQWTLYEARSRAQEIRRLVDAGEDPTPIKSTVMTIREAFEEFERSRRLKGRGDRTLKDYRSQMERYVFPKWGRIPVDRLTRPEVASLHDRITATGLKARGNRVLATISSLYGWLQRERDYKGVNPATGIERTQEHGRDTFLQPDQVARLKMALQEYAEDVGGRSRNNDVAADAIWFCLVTGARSGEVKRATWDQFDPALTVWVKPASTTKQRKLHRVPLSPGAQEVLLRRRGLARPGETHVFPSQLGDKLIALRYAWETVTRSAGLDGVRIHDLRHSYASLAISAGVPLTVVGGLLGHAVPATTARYVHLIDNDLRAAVGRVNAVIDGDSE